MMNFTVNNIRWTILRVPSHTPVLRRSNNTYTVGVTDNNSHRIYLDRELRGAFLEKVLCHELCHVFMFSYEIDIPLEQEEFIAQWISLYGRDVIDTLDMILKQLNSNTNVQIAP